jgi:hypothetical protein
VIARIGTTDGSLLPLGHWLYGPAKLTGCGWIGGEIANDDPCWFGDGLIRNMAAALAKINTAGRLANIG